MGANVLQAGEHSQAQVLHIRAPFAQVGVLHLLEAADVFADDVLEGALRPLPAADALAHVAGDGVIVEHVQVSVEQRQLLARQALRKLFADPAQVAAHGLHRPVKHDQFHSQVLGLGVPNRIQAGGWVHDYAHPEGDAGRSGQAGNLEVLLGKVRVKQAVHFANGLSAGDDRSELRGQRDQKGFFAFVKAAPFAVLHHQHPQHLAVMDDGHAQKGVERLFAELRQVEVAGMPAGVLQVDGFRPLPHQADQADAFIQGRSAHQLRVEPLVGGEQVLIAARGFQIDRAHFRVESGPHFADDELQRLRKSGRGAYILNDLSKKGQHSTSSVLQRR